MRDRCLTLKEIEALTSLRKPTIYRLMKTGDFPAQVRISPNRVAWMLSTIEDWLAERMTEATR